MRFLSWLVDGLVGLIVALAGYTSPVEGGTAATVVRRWSARAGSWMSRVAHRVWPDVPDQRRAPRPGGQVAPGDEEKRA